MDRITTPKRHTFLILVLQNHCFHANDLSRVTVAAKNCITCPSLSNSLDHLTTFFCCIKKVYLATLLWKQFHSVF